MKHCNCFETKCEVHGPRVTGITPDDINTCRLCKNTGLFELPQPISLFCDFRLCNGCIGLVEDYLVDVNRVSRNKHDVTH